MHGMDERTVQKLRELDEAFYRDNAASFSHTRQHAWPGWERVIESLSCAPATVLDVACGNARLKEFVDKRFGDGHAQYYGVDSCPDLLPQGGGIGFQCLDIIECLLEGSLATSIEAPSCDLTACFGFMHHVPTHELRSALLNALVEKTVSGGMLAVSFWQFADDPKTLEKARMRTARGCAELGISLDEGDYLLGWNDMPGTYRYCHSFNDDEIDELSAQVADRVVLVDRFKADGKTGQMNGYLVLRNT